MHLSYPHDLYSTKILNSIHLFNMICVTHIHNNDIKLTVSRFGRLRKNSGYTYDIPTLLTVKRRQKKL